MLPYATMVLHNGKWEQIGPYCYSLEAARTQAKEVKLAVRNDLTVRIFQIVE